LVESFAIVDKQCLDSLKALNGVRNDCAHKFNYEITEEDIERIGITQGKGFTRIKKEFPDGPGAWLGAVLPYICGKLAPYAFFLENSRNRQQS
jgi:hypothetical protein